MAGVTDNYSVTRKHSHSMQIKVKVETETILFDEERITSGDFQNSFTDIYIFIVVYSR